MPKADGSLDKSSSIIERAENDAIMMADTSLNVLKRESFPMPQEYQPHYKWRETWAGEGRQDFEGFDGEQRFGRIQIGIAGNATLGMWKWNATHVAWVRRHVMVDSGWQDSAREAARMAEEHYDKLRELHGLRR